MGDLSRPRLLNDRAFPAYAYLPGSHQPHPVRDPSGHSHEHETLPRAHEPAKHGDALKWGIDLFNHGYYWEAHEAWEPLWLAAKGKDDDRALFKGLVMLAATGVKVREGKRMAALRHAGKAAHALRQLPQEPQAHLLDQIGIPPHALAGLAEAASRFPVELPKRPVGQPEPVFSFMLWAGCDETLASVER
jgi:predicted metal-dependent hydrolase